MLANNFSSQTLAVKDIVMKQNIAKQNSKSRFQHTPVLNRNVEQAITFNQKTTEYREVT